MVSDVTKSDTYLLDLPHLPRIDCAGLIETG